MCSKAVAGEDGDSMYLSRGMRIDVKIGGQSEWVHTAGFRSKLSYAYSSYALSEVNSSLWSNQLKRRRGIESHLVV
jgi:hypothetical protein